MQVSKNIFRNYDIRGVYPTEINEDVALHLGRAFGTLLRKKFEFPRVVVCRDDRESSPSLSEHLIKGLLSAGCHVTDTGISVTPAMHFFTIKEDFDMGINVTASHNPKEFNGFRIDYRNARSFYGDLLLMIRFIVDHGDYTYGTGDLEVADLNKKYIEYLKKQFSFKKNLKVVIDCGSGATSEIATKLFENMNCHIFPVYCRYDSNFPKGVPDPENKLYMEDLRHYVLENGADVGLAYDTDGDRFGMVDDKGVVYDTDILLLLYAKHVLQKNPGKTVVYDVKCSSIVDEYITKYKGIPKVMRTGHPYFADEVEDNAILGAEYSGHIYFSDRYFGYDDGLYASLRLVEILDKSKKKLSEMMAEYPKRYSTNEIKVDCPDEDKFKVINLIKIDVMNNHKYQKMVDIDGIRVLVTKTGWFLIRASNTSPYLSIRVEGKDEEEKNHLLQIVRDAIKNVSIVKLNINF